MITVVVERRMRRPRSTVIMSGYSGKITVARQNRIRRGDATVILPGGAQSRHTGSSLRRVWARHSATWGKSD